MGAGHNSKYFEVTNDIEFSTADLPRCKREIGYEILVVEVKSDDSHDQHSDNNESVGCASAVVTAKTPLDFDLQVSLQTHNERINELYRKGFTLCALIPLFPSRLCTNESSMDLNNDHFLMVFSHDAKSKYAQQPLSWQLIRTELNTSVIRDVETLIVGSQKLIINEAENDPLLQTISHGTANGGRLAVANALSNYCKQSSRSLSSIRMPIDVIFELPQVVNTCSFAYNLFNATLYQEPDESVLDNENLIRMNCDWVDCFRKSLEAGWKLIDIACDTGNFFSEPCSVWFFEKKTSDTLHDDPCYEGRVIELMVDFDRCLGPEFSNFVAAIQDSISHFGSDGWLFTCAVFPDNVIVDSLHSIPRRVITFFQRRLEKSQPVRPTDFHDVRFAPPSYSTNLNDQTLPPSYDEAVCQKK